MPETNQGQAFDAQGESPNIDSMAEFSSAGAVPLQDETSRNKLTDEQQSISAEFGNFIADQILSNDTPQAGLVIELRDPASDEVE